MAEIIKFKSFRDYAKFNQEFIHRNPMLHFHLENTIKRVFNREVPLIKFFNVTDNACFLSVLLIKDECLIYADNVNDEVISKLSEGLEFHLFNRYQFFGTKQVVDALFIKHNVEYNELKFRIIYECKLVSPDFFYSPGQASMADERKLLELSSFNVAFSKEYFENNQSLEKAIAMIRSGISNKNLFQWSNDNNLCAIAQVLYDDFDFPVIGHVFTAHKFRNQGFAASLVHSITKGLIAAGNEKCMLTANAYNPASNKAFIRAGYIATGEYVIRYKKK